MNTGRIKKDSNKLTVACFLFLISYFLFLISFPAPLLPVPCSPPRKYLHFSYFALAFFLHLYYYT